MSGELGKSFRMGFGGCLGIAAALLAIPIILAIVNSCADRAERRERQRLQGGLSEPAAEQSYVAPPRTPAN